MAEDIKFAQHVKRRGKKMVYGDGSRVYAVRMYASLRGIWDGFSKNLFPAMGKSLPVLLVWSLFLLCTQILPFVFLLIGFARGDRVAGRILSAARARLRRAGHSGCAVAAFSAGGLGGAHAPDWLAGNACHRRELGVSGLFGPGPRLEGARLRDIARHGVQ
jgi:hypothetical protein